MEGESHIIQVWEQKTAKTDGCAEIIVPHDVFKQLKTFVQQYRPVSSSDSLFVKWSGSPMDCGAVCHAFSMELSHNYLLKAYFFSNQGNIYRALQCKDHL